MQQALAHRRAALRLGNVGNAAGLLAGLDVFDLEVAAIRDDVDRLDPQDFAGRLRSFHQQAHVHDLVCHRLFDDQLVRRVDRHLNVVADADLRMRGHGAAVRIGQRDLVPAGSVELGQHRLVTAALFVERGNPFGQVLRACAAACRAVLDIALVEPLEVVFQPIVGAADDLSQRRAGEVAILVVDRLDAGSLDRQQLAAVQVEASAQQYELRNTARNAARLSPEIGDGLEVRFQSPQQPEDLDVAMTLRLQPPARSDPVQIAVDVELQKVARRVAGTAHRFRLDPQKPRRRKVQSVNEGVDEPHRIVRADIVVHRLRQQQKLVAFQSGDVSHA